MVHRIVGMHICVCVCDLAHLGGVGVILQFLSCLEGLYIHLLTAPTSCLHPEAAPATVKLYLNKTSFSFDDAENIEPTQVLELTEEDYKAEKVMRKEGEGRECEMGRGGQGREAKKRRKRS